MNLPQKNNWRWAGGAAALLYVLIGVGLILQKPGLQYDEALLQYKVVLMLNSPLGHLLPRPGHSWRVMVMPYLGAAKDYVLLLPFLAFGPKLEVSRAISMLLGVFGILGIWKLLADQMNEKEAAAVAFILAFHPAYLGQTVFDNSAVAFWMGSLGLVAIAFSSYLKRRTNTAAFWLGVMMGIAIWGRVNFVWLLIAVFMAAVFVLQKRILVPARQFASWILGGVLGGLPLLLYLVQSRGGTIRFLIEQPVNERFTALLAFRLRILAETQLADSEQRRIWDGPPIPQWQTVFFFLVVIVGILVCLFFKEGETNRMVHWRRICALTFLFFAAFMLCSRLNIQEHHLVTLVPLAVVIVVTTLQALIHRWRTFAVVAFSVGLIYLGSAVYCNLAAMQGLSKTGGINSWSDGIFSVNEYLLAHYPGETVKILDWGLSKNLFVLSNSKISGNEIFWRATREMSGSGKSWQEEVAEGGIFLTTAGKAAHFPEPRFYFTQALALSGQPFKRVEFFQKQGGLFAELVEVTPAPAHNR